MIKLKTIIIDDEERARNVLFNLLKRYPSIEIVANCDNLIEGVQEIKECNPDIVFLDIQMPNYAGYEIASFIDEIDFDIIFVTAFDQYAIKAFELNATDYLVKPVDRKMLNKAIEKVEERLSIEKDLSRYKMLLNSIQEKKFKQLVVPQLGNRKVVNIEDILAVEADGAYSKIHMSAKESITTSKNLKYFEGILSLNEQFIRIHRAWIINRDHLTNINRSKQTAILGNGLLETKISRSKLKDLDIQSL
ncbi:LytR/AlgR family response regulator transcription factor [Reichenbachiella versicolor]|uniref:LytR/AlgR family response regulator transcription factor n=1 Tax=Reichenbachiella versicolor TaxID=1821036 RepID=UPI000D6E6714|nr:response regulator [Reichenbachiella versicolor]